MKDKLKAVKLLHLLTGLLFLFACFFVSAEEALISVVMLRSGNVSYISLIPLHYEAKRKGFPFVQIPSGDSFKEKKPMELIIYSTCDRVDPKKGSVLGYRPQFLHSNLLLSPHPKDRPAAYYLSPIGLFRMFKQLLLKGWRPHFE